jgi:rhodanese-related sulfurtransferase
MPHIKTGKGGQFSMRTREPIAQRVPRRALVLTITTLALILTGAVLAGCAGPPVATRAVVSAQLITPLNYQTMFEAPDSHLLLDVRTAEEFASGYIPGAVNISVETLASRLDEIPSDTPVVVYCRSGNRSATAARILVDAGFGPVYDLGGIQTWIAQGLPVIP